MKFLKSFWNLLKEFIHSYSFEKKLKKNDDLGRYLTSSNHFSIENDRVRYNALMPLKNQKTDEFETSVFNIEGLNSKEIKGLANKSILPNLPNNRSIYGTGITNKKQIINFGLVAKISEPPKRHLNIIGWPEEKSKQKQLAMELAPLCTLSLFEQKLN